MDLENPRLSVEWVGLDRLYGSPSNPRRNEDAVPHVVASLRRFGWQQPIVARPDGEVIAGNTRLKAAHELALTEVPVAWFAGTDLDAAAYQIADNRTHEFASWDEAGLASILQELRTEDALEGVGYDAGEIDSLLAQLGEELGKGLEDPGPEEPPAAPVSSPGDLWRLGRHRVLCGDCTQEGAVQGLLGGATPMLMVTDPPYGVSYEPAWRNEAGVSATKRTGKVANDDRADWTEAWRLFPGDVAYVWHDAKSCGEVAASLGRAGLDVRSQLIWAKSRFALSRGSYHWQHEPCWYSVRRGGRAHWVGGRAQSTVWEIASTDDGDATFHGTQKPLECMARAIRNHSAEEVYDPFLGSGTTLIAAENQGRTCLGVEIDPAYVDVTIQRWERGTGLEAVLAETRQTFAQVSAERGAA